MKKMNEMNIKEKIGHTLFAGFPGTEYNDVLKTLIEEYHVSNFILFARNIENLDQLAKLTKAIHSQVWLHTKTIPLIAIDQEGGIVTRIMQGATFFPGAMSIAATTEENAYAVGQMMAEELLHLGINMNLAPVLDVNNNPKNPVIGVRSYGDDPQAVSRFGVQAILGMQSKKMIATAKHFPGHGDVEVDSHLGLPVVEHSLKRLAEVELFPFQEAIKAGVKAIMSAHIFFKAYEKESLPATLSEKVLTGLLRKQMGFDGLIVSDCMEMKAIDDLYTSAVGSVMGIKAGLDMVFISHTLEKQISYLNLLEKEIKENRFSEALLDQKLKRIFEAKQYGADALNEAFLNKEEPLSFFKTTTNQKSARLISDRALTLIKGEHLIPSKNTLVFATVPFATTIAEDELDERNLGDQIKKEIPDYTVLKMPIREYDSTLLAEVSKYEQVVICSYQASMFPAQQKMIKEIARIQPNCHLLCTRNPYDYLLFPMIRHVVSAYEYTPVSIQSIVAYLKGNLKPTGKLPLHLKQTFPISASLYVGLDTYPLKENLTYLDMLASKGIKRIFMSAHMPEASPQLMEELQIIIKKAQAKKIKITLDVSKPTFDQMGCPEGIDTLRLDWGFSLQDTLDLAKKGYHLELNASVIREQELRYLLENGLDLGHCRISHNFYPKPYTGLNQTDFLAKNRLFHQYGLEVMAFIPSQAGKRPPLGMGLPTCEDHRNLMLEAVLSEMAILDIDEICFGDAYCSVEELDRALVFDRNECVLPITFSDSLSAVEKDILKKKHQPRRDANNYFIRSSHREKQEIVPCNTIERKKFMVTIDNTLFKRYQGEVSIMKSDLPADKKVNVVGKAAISSFLLENMKAGQTFRFIEEKNGKSNNSR